MRLHVTALVLLALVAPTTAYSTPSSFAHQEVTQDLDSGDYANPDDATNDFDLEWSTTITSGEEHNSQWMRIHFDRINIGLRDYLKFTSVMNGWTYELRGNDIYASGEPRVDVSHFSLFMPGNSVEIELYSEDGSFGDGVHVDYVHVGVADPSDVPCQSDLAEPVVDDRVCRIVGLRDVALYNGNRYVTCSGTLLFPGSCIVTSAAALDGVSLDKQSLIVQFQESQEPDGGGGYLVRGHVRPTDQYRFLEGTDCVGPTHGRVMSFRVRPNEHTGWSPAMSYRSPWWFGGSQLADASDIVPDLAIIVRGYEDLGSWSLADQSADMIHDPGGPDQDFLTFVSGTGAVEHTSQASSFGMEGAPILEDRLIAKEEGDRIFYGLNTELSCGIIPVHQGTSMRDPDLDLESAVSCIEASCNDADGEYPLISIPWTYHRTRPVVQFAVTLGGQHLELDLSGEMQMVTIQPHMFGNGLWRQTSRVTSLHLRGVSCKGAVDVTLDPTQVQLHRVVQLTSGSLYPASGQLDLALEFDVGGMRLKTGGPVTLAATIDDTPGYGETWTIVEPVTLFDIQLQPVGTLDAGSVQIRQPRTEVEASAQIRLTAQPTVEVSGAIELELDATKWDEDERSWATRMEWRRLAQVGTSPPLGTIAMRASNEPTRRSLGTLVYPFMPDTFPLAQKGDLYIELDLKQQQKTLVNLQPISFGGRWSTLFPNGDTLRSGGPVALYNKATLQFETTLEELVMVGGPPTLAEPDPEPALDAFCATGQLVLDVGQGPVTLGGLLGRVQMRRHEPTPDPYLAWHVPTELVTLDLEASGTPLGNIIVRRGASVSTGAMDQQGPGSPSADCELDVFLEIQTPAGVVRNLMPMRIEGVIDTIPIQQPLITPSTHAPVALVNSSGKPVGQLYRFTLMPGMLYDAACPAGITCSPNNVDVGDRPGAGVTRAWLHPIAPNPMHGAVRLGVDLPAGTDVALGVFDVAGRMVHEIANGRFAGGTRQFEWRGNGSNGQRVAPGLYFVRLRAGGEVHSRSVVVRP